MTKTKFRRQAEELGIRFVGDYPIVNLPHLQYIKLRDGKVWSSWSRSSGGNKNRLRVHRGFLKPHPTESQEYADFDDMDQALAKVCEWRLIDDPIVFAAALSPHQREDEGPRGS